MESAAYSRKDSLRPCNVTVTLLYGPRAIGNLDVFAGTREGGSGSLGRVCTVVYPDLRPPLHRLYVKGAILGFLRGMRNQYEDTSLISIEGLKDKKVMLSIG